MPTTMAPAKQQSQLKLHKNSGVFGLRFPFPPAIISRRILILRHLSVCRIDAIAYEPSIAMHSLAFRTRSGNLVVLRRGFPRQPTDSLGISHKCAEYRNSPKQPGHPKTSLTSIPLCVSTLDQDRTRELSEILSAHPVELRRKFSSLRGMGNGL